MKICQICLENRATSGRYCNACSEKASHAAKAPFADTQWDDFSNSIHLDPGSLAIAQIIVREEIIHGERWGHPITRVILMVGGKASALFSDSSSELYYFSLDKWNEIKESSKTEPYQLSPDPPPWIYLYDGKYLLSNMPASKQQLVEHIKNTDLDFRRAKYEVLDELRGTAKKAGEESKRVEEPRRHIDDQVKIFVWRRDQGRCVKCGSQENLEFDHIIPVFKGGGNSARNIQLLCESCNRSKGSRII